jgi:hypothetical protein
VPALAVAGYQAVAPDMRGYGQTDAPPNIQDYTQFQFVGDVVGLVHILGYEQAVEGVRRRSEAHAAHVPVLASDEMWFASRSRNFTVPEQRATKKLLVRLISTGNRLRNGGKTSNTSGTMDLTIRRKLLRWLRFQIELRIDRH